MIIFPVRPELSLLNCLSPIRNTKLMNFLDERYFGIKVFIEKMLNRTKVRIKVNTSKHNFPCSHETLNLDASSKENEIQKKSV